MNEEKKVSPAPEAKVAKQPEPPVETAKEDKVAAVTETPTQRAITKWISKRVHNSPISRNTEVFNYLMKRLPELASMIDEENKA